MEYSRDQLSNLVGASLDIASMSNIRDLNERFILGKGDDEDRLSYSPQDFLGDASQKSMTDGSLSMGSHDDCVTRQFIRFFKYLFGWVAFTDLYQSDPGGTWRIVFTFQVAECAQSVSDLVFQVRFFIEQDVLDFILSARKKSKNNLVDDPNL